MNLTNKIGNISIEVADIGLDIKIEGIEVSTTDINPVDYIQVIKAKKEHVAEVNKAINGIIGAIKEGLAAQSAPTSNPFASSNPFAGMGVPVGLKKSGPSQGDLNAILGAMVKDLKEAAEEAKKEQEKGGQNPFPFGGIKF